VNRFASIVLDVDSTLAGIEGVDWLASLRGPDMEARTAELTDRAMRGLIPLEAVYAERVNAVRPTRAEIDELATHYIEQVAPGARETLADLKNAGVGVTIASGGFQQAIIPLAAAVGISADNVHAVRLFFNEQGDYAGFDEGSLLARQYGKRETIRSLNLDGPILAVGDGVTDSEIAAVVDAFAVFTGFVRREAVIAQAEYVLESFDELRRLVIE
jgi:HAD superfamily phosphoserine phosphatase-like hydrolase